MHVCGVTDCKTSIVKAGCTPSDARIFEHVGFINHRLESTMGIVFNRPVVKKCMAPAR